MPENYIITYTGKRALILEPRVEDIDIIDIAHHLSNICRFTGAVRDFYSVAQHCYYVSEYCEPVCALEGLLHDATEAYLADVSTPLKQSGRMDAYKELEKIHGHCIQQAFGLKHANHPSIKEADGRVFHMEVRSLMPSPEEFGFFYPEAEQWKTDNTHIRDFWSPKEAKMRFLERFIELYSTAERNARTGAYTVNK